MSNTLGNTAEVVFVDANKTVTGKVDSGATTSSLHAENIKIDKNRVSFNCPELSQHTITMDLESVQQVKTADGGTGDRPTIKLNIKINNVPLQGMMFNLNDRGHMDSPILIGQNILKAGNFVIDVNEEIQLQLPDDAQPVVDQPDQETPESEKIVKDAVLTLIRHNVSFADFLRIASE